MEMLKKYPAIFWGLGITLLFLLLWMVHIEFLDALENRYYDLRIGMRSQSQGDGESPLVVVEIDDQSVERLGRWPWPRSLLARGLDKIEAGDPRIIGLNVICSEPQESAGLQEIQRLIRIARQEGTPEDSLLFESLQGARQKLDHDSKLARAIADSGRVVMPVVFKTVPVPQEDTGQDQRELLAPHGIQALGGKPARLPRGDEIIMPIPQFFKAVDGIGHVNLEFDPDGKVRREQLIYRFGGLYIPAFSIRIAGMYLKVPQEKIRAVPGSQFRLGSLDIPTTPQSEMLVSFKGKADTFKRIPFYDVIEDKVPPSLFKDKIVLISPSASGIMNPLSTPTASAMSLGEFSANVIWTVLNKQFIFHPGWDFFANLLLILAIGGMVGLVMPRMKALWSGLTFGGLLIVLIGGSTYLLVSQGLWIRVTYPVLQLILGYIGVVSLNFFITEARKEKVEGESAETNRMLGLSFQSQGMLDMAFDKFRKVPMDEEMKDILYNLGLDYERKRQFNKAANVYEHIEKYDEEYKDVAERKKKLLQASETMVYGDGTLGGGSKGDPLLSTTTGTRPTLGRYEVMKQLGRGAMGIVYLGRDPRINRTTAIKTFRFSEDFDPEEAESLKEKFFREAESAGTLSHPNIVTIYDAGDEQDLAYIAMEYLEGEDFQKYTKKGNLMPMRKVLDYVADIAEALDYAHQQGVVHRDIKPANVMFLKSGIVKITDFGIARITASSQTQTGVVKGTPHYMSPEQISGKKVDGRSDIFSLGVMLYQLLTGELPFAGDSPAALMHQIMNVPHPDPRKFNPKLLKPHVVIINKALEKERPNRYQRAVHMANHLRTLGQKIDSLMARRKANQTIG